MILHYPSVIDANLLPPGQFVFLICDDGEEHRGELLLRKAGLEVRDSIRWFHGSPVKHLTVVVGRKPIEGTVAENTLRYGCGGIHVDACRVKWLSEHDMLTGRPASFPKSHEGFEGKSFKMNDRSHRDPVAEQNALGRWPANVIHDGECGDLFPETFGGGIPKTKERIKSPVQMAGPDRLPYTPYADTLGGGGSASRFFYVAETETALIEYLNRLVKS
jgi:site-specific DNA-methyltransferase (adenine-specific)